IETLREYPGLGWIAALRGEAIRELLERGRLQRSLFDRKDLAEIRSPDFPGERLIACYNPLLAERRQQKRRRLLEATEANLRRLEGEVRRRTKKPLSAAAIGLKAGKVLGRYKMAKHFRLEIADGRVAWARDEAAIRREEQLDGIYVIRTSERAKALPAADCVRTYKSLAQVEQAFRCFKGLDLRVRPIHHRVDPRVRAHLFLCLLAYYVEWRMRQALASLLYADEELAEDRQERDPVKPAQPSATAQAKKETHETESGLPVQSFGSLLAHLARRVRNTPQIVSDPPGAAVHQLTEADAPHAQAPPLLHL